MRLSHLFLACLCCITVLSHQASAADSVTFSALFFPANLSAKEPEFFMGDLKSRQKVAIPITMLGGPFKGTLREGGFLDLFAKEADESPAISVHIPDTARERLLLLFVPKSSGYQAHALSLPADGFNGGAVLAMNAAPMDVSIRYGKDAGKPIKPGAYSLLVPPANFREPMIPVQIYKRDENAIADAESGAPAGWRIVQSVRWAVDKRFRSYLFLYQSPETKRIMVRSVPERTTDD